MNMSATIIFDPVFVVSSVRSGSTFLRLMLDAHPEIWNPGECDFLFDKIGDNGALPSSSAYAEWLASNRIFLGKGLKIDNELSSRELIRSFVGQMKCGDGTLAMNVHRHFHRIPNVFPNSKFIHLQRDPRDVANSCIGMGWAGNVYFGVDIWQEAEASWRMLRSLLKHDQYMEIRYEDLVGDVVSSLSSICQFLGLEYSDKMLHYAQTSTYGLPDKSLSFQWKRKLSPRELQLVEGKLRFQLSELGYEPSGYGPALPDPMEKFNLFLDNKLFRIRFQQQRYGLPLYLETFLATKSGIKFWRNACQRRKNQIDMQHLK